MKNAILPTLVSILLSSHAQATPEHDRYSKIYPLHAEYCSLSQERPFADKAGGIAGHAVIYIHGLCKDSHANYPRVLPCAELNPSERTHDGVGVSIDGDYRNVNWTAVPGYDLYTNGITPHHDSDGNPIVDQAAVDATVEVTLQTHAFQGVNFNPERVDPNLPAKEFEAAVIKRAIATDLALRFGRNLSCVRLPLIPAKIKGIADYMNRINEPYVTGKAVFHWSLIHDNCSQFSSNVLAAVGIRSELKTNVPFLKQIGNVGVPRNSLMMLQDIIHYRKIDFKSVHRDSLRWNTVANDGYLATGLGGLSVQFDIFENNELYSLEKLHSFALPTLRFGNFRRSNEAFQEERFTDLQANAEYWKSQYEGALEQSLDKNADDSDAVLYQNYLKGQIEESEKVLLKLK